MSHRKAKLTPFGRLSALPSRWVSPAQPPTSGFGGTGNLVRLG